MSGSSPPREETVHDAKSNSLHSMAKRIASHFPQVPLISSTELRQLQDMDTRGGPQVVLVDCRTAQETAVSMIPGSLTQEEFETRRREMEGRTVVTYCTVGYRSSGYAAKLRGQGLEARNLEGGIVRWTQKRYPLVARDTEGGEVETKRVHVYAKPWALQPDDYEAVMFAHPFVSWLRRLLPPWLGGKNAFQHLEATTLSRGFVQLAEGDNNFEIQHAQLEAAQAELEAAQQEAASARAEAAAEREARVAAQQEWALARRDAAAQLRAARLQIRTKSLLTKEQAAAMVCICEFLRLGSHLLAEVELPDEEQRGATALLVCCSMLRSL
ncbi:hypothetical protein ABPG75_013709 [Micractinium tetrahymenae]